MKPHQWCNGIILASSAVDCRFKSQSDQIKPKTIKLVYAALLSTQQVGSTGKSKDSQSE